MRLTLRTLLAYMDDILDPADHEDLGQKIESSEFATELIHRSRDAVRRLRLGAPDVFSGDSDDVLGNDAHLNANTVAAYLDNTLAPEQVAEFEQKCLELGPDSDLLLAETTSCHHVLTMVLGEPAEVDADLRQRLYDMGADAEGEDGVRLNQPPVELDSQYQEAAEGEERDGLASPYVGAEDHVPDYLRAAAAAKHRHRRILVGLVGCALVVGLVWFTVGPQVVDRLTAHAPETPADVETTAGHTGEAPEYVVPQDDSTGTADAVGVGDDRHDEGRSEEASPPHSEQLRDVPQDPDVDPGLREPTVSGEPISRHEPVEQQEASVPVETVSESVQQAQVAVESDATSMDPRNEHDTTPVADLDHEGDPEILVETDDATRVQAAANGTAPPEEPSPQAMDETVEVEGVASDVTPANHDLVLPPAPETSGGDLVSAVPPLVDSADRPAEIELTAADIDVSPPVQPDSDENASDDTEHESDAIVSSRGSAAADEPQQPAVVANYFGNDDVLLTFDDASGGWVRLKAGTQLMSGTRVASLPTLRTHLAVDDMNLFLAGGTELLLGAASDVVGADAIALQLVRGRLIMTAGLSGNHVDLIVGEHFFSIQMEASATLALELDLDVVPFVASDSDAKLPTVNWFLTSGKAGLVNQSDSMDIVGPATWFFQEGDLTPAKHTDAFPEWINGQSVVSFERNARDQLAKELAPSQLVELTLLEFADKSARGRRRENRKLATVCSAQLGEFEPYVRALNDRDQHAYWSELILAVRRTIAINPSAVDDLERSFNSLLGPEAAKDLTELTLGYDLGPFGDTATDRQMQLFRRLADWMDRDQLEYRVLAQHNVSELTGAYGRGGYRALHSAEQRARSLRHYRDISELWQRAKSHLGMAASIQQ